MNSRYSWSLHLATHSLVTPILVPCVLCARNTKPMTIQQACWQATSVARGTCPGICDTPIACLYLEAPSVCGSPCLNFHSGLQITILVGKAGKAKRDSIIAYLRIEAVWSFHPLWNRSKEYKPTTTILLCISPCISHYFNVWYDFMHFNLVHEPSVLWPLGKSAYMLLRDHDHIKITSYVTLAIAQRTNYRRSRNLSRIQH